MTVLPRSTPSEQGVDALGVLDLVDALEAQGHDPHSLVLARHGQVIARGWWAPYAPERVQLVYSLSKTFTATAVGVLVDEGRLSLDQPVLELLPPADLPEDTEVSDRYRRLTLGHCLTMATGHDGDAWGPEVTQAASTPPAGDEDPVLRAVLAHDPEHEPGTAWAYNQVATYLAAGAVRGATGGSVLSLLRERVLPLLDPSSVDRVGWHRTITGRELGFSGIHVGTDAILALAQAYLGGGEAAGRRLLSPEWVAAATASTGLPNREEAPNPDWTQGYGCSFWHARHGFRGDGAYGQYAIVLPEQDIALAITSETTDMQAVLDLVWDHLLPAVGEVDEVGDELADAALEERMELLQVPTPASTADGPDDARWRRAGDSTFPEAYAAVRLTRVGEDGETADTAYSLVLEGHGAEVTVPVGDGVWVDSTPELAGRVLPFSAAGGWAEDGTFAADLRLIETPHTVRVRTRGDGTVHLGWHEVPLQTDDPLYLSLRGPAAPPQT
ncbi:CubicO group peptidase, beta-lactamase class C family [Pedococcus dokdonensis]|uniref:CubicO group peptidase, beta-lactamase class C family n=1 Tax=Pedococcus dokdonensis TaxID=443156 RepID=A0A1H0RTQ8_9MICO|nr:serine hydrolase domain-containing protein [Pedococcus dokdonensis]SDP32348.1 CubicO group peptidase, beta-lactamase class C family [Pedococcus dokdonensis]